MPRGIMRVTTPASVKIGALYLWSKIDSWTWEEDMEKYRETWPKETTSYWEGYHRAIRDVQRTIQRKAAKVSRELMNASRNK